MGEVFEMNYNLSSSLFTPPQPSTKHRNVFFYLKK